MSTTPDTAPCDRFEREGLLALERGEPLDPHFETCPACRDARAAYERLHDGLASFEADDAGRTDWQARVWAGVARREQARERRWLWLALPALAAAAAVLFWFTRGEPTRAPVLAYEIHRPSAAEPLRSDHAQPGDLLLVRARAHGRAHIELRLYRDDRALVAHCTRATPCPRPDRADRDGLAGGLAEDDSTESDLVAELPLERRGRYQLVLLRSDAPVPAPAGDLDSDLARARQGGALVELVEIDVL